MAIGWRDQYNRYRAFYEHMLSIYKQRKDLRAFLEVILSLSTVIIFVVFALKPTALTIISLYNEVKDRKVILASLNQKVANLQTANKVFVQNQNFIPDINLAIFDIPQPDTVSKQILGLGAKNSISVLGISIGQVVMIGKNTIPLSSSDVKPLPAGAYAMPVSISVKGTYTNLLNFVKDFENLRIISKIDSLTINSSQTQEGNIIVGVITARIPYLGSI